MRFNKDELKRRREIVAALLKAVRSGEFVNDKTNINEKKVR